MLIQNLDQVEGLCNETRLIISRMANHVIEARIIFGKKCRKLGLHFVNVIITISISLAFQDD